MAKVKAEAKTEAKAEFVIADLAEALDLEPGVVRQKLRNLEVEKFDEKRYLWKGQKSFDAVVKLLKSNTKEKVEDVAPAKKNGKKAEPEAKGKNGKKDEKAPKNKASSAPETKTEKKRPKPQGARD